MVEHDARRTVLSLLSAMGKPFPVAALLHAAEILGIEPGAVRMALTRLKSQNVVENPSRGVWAIGTSGLPIHTHIGAWRAIQSRAMGWDERTFLAVMRAPRRDLKQAQVQRGERALCYLGFEHWREHVWVRPANLVAGVAGVRKQLQDLGLAPGGAVLTLSGLDSTTYDSLINLWDVQGLEAGYASCLDAMNQADLLVPTLEPDVAARQVYEVGDKVIRTLALDPVLPASMVNVTQRAACLHKMHGFDAGSKEIWGHVLQDLL